MEKGFIHARHRAESWHDISRLYNFGHTDRFAIAHSNGTYGVIRVEGYVKFYCKNLVDTLSLPSNQSGVYTGDLGTLGHPSDDGIWQPGGAVDATGVVPSTRNEPDWWKKMPVDGTAVHKMFNNWRCCDCPEDFSESRGHPTNEQDYFETEDPLYR